jgi:hypothetical protein
LIKTTGINGTSSTGSFTSVTTSATPTFTQTTESTHTGTETSATLPQEQLVGGLADVEAAFVGSILAGNETDANFSIGGLTISAKKLSAAELASLEAPLEVPVGDSGMVVSVPPSLFAIDAMAGRDEAILVASYFAPSLLPNVAADTGATEDQLKSVVGISLYATTAGGGPEAVEVQGLQEPVKMKIPLKAAGQDPSLACAFWDEELSQWSTSGLQKVSSGDGYVTCATVHFSLFAAIAEGFLTAFSCSQVSLLSSESYEELLYGQWLTKPGAIFMYSLVAVWLLLMLCAAILDSRRRRMHSWGDECFLIPLSAEEPPLPASGAAGALAVLCGSSLCVGCLVVFMESAKDGFDDLISNFCSWFGDVRGTLEELCAGVSGVMSGGYCSCSGLSDRLLYSLHARNVELQSVASLGLHADDIAFISSDELQAEVQAIADAEAGGSLQTLSALAAASPACQQRLEYLARRQQSLQEHGDMHFDRLPSWCSLPKMVGRSFWSRGPIGTVVAESIFTTSSMRALFLLCRVLGSLSMVTVFFSAMGGAASKRNKPVCEQEQDFWGKVGRVLAIATASMIISGLPLSLLATLHSRSLKKFPFEGCPEWQRQLRAWRCQDRIIWVIGLAYCGFAINFLMLFFANVADEDQADWITSAAICILEDFIVIPLLLAFLYPFFALLFLCVLKTKRKTTRKDLLAGIRSADSAARDARGRAQTSPADPESTSVTRVAEHSRAKTSQCLRCDSSRSLMSSSGSIDPLTLLSSRPHTHTSSKTVTAEAPSKMLDSSGGVIACYPWGATSSSRSHVSTAFLSEMLSEAPRKQDSSSIECSPTGNGESIIAEISREIAQCHEGMVKSATLCGLEPESKSMDRKVDSAMETEVELRATGSLTFGLDQLHASLVHAAGSAEDTEHSFCDTTPISL